MQDIAISTLILDLDGPILEGRRRHYACYKSILEDNGFRPASETKYWQAKRARADRHAQLSLSKADEIYDVFLKQWIERIETMKYLNLDEVQEGAYQKLEEWKNSGRRLILVTMRRNRENLLKQLDNLSLSGFFDSIISCNPLTETSKTQALMKNSSDINPEKTVWIGDTEVDLKGAREIGCRSILVTNGIRNEEYLRSLHPDTISPSIMHIAI